MTIERFLQLLLGSQIILAALLLYIGQGVFWVVPCVAFFVLASFLVVDKYKLFHLGSFWLNLLTILVTGFCVYDMFFNIAPFQLVISAANGLLLIELILLLRQKTFQTYWLLFLLSFFQVIVGAAFRQQTSFGILLFLFMGIALATLITLTFYRQSEDCDSSMTRMPLCPRLAGRFASIGLFSIFVSVLFFLLMPRMGEGFFLGIPGRHGGNRPATVGFNDVIRLGDLGPSQKDSSTVCQVSLFQGNSSTFAQRTRQLYLRGVTLNVYSDRQWRRENQPNRELIPQPSPMLKRFANLKTAPDQPSQDDENSNQNLTTRIVYNVNPTRHLDAFAVWPFYPRDLVQFRIAFTFNARDQRLKCREFFTRQPHSYEFYSPSVQHGTQVECTPKLFPQAFTPLLQIPQDDQGVSLVPSAKKLALEWLEEAGLSVENDGVEKVARQLCRKLRDSGEFVYSVNPQSRIRSLDPLEDFLSQHKAGHCEFFASALTMILRSVDIPAQVVVGYVTDEYNKYGNYFTVRQRHAHAWVEVWVPPTQLDLDYDAPTPAIVTADNFNSYKKTWTQRDWRYGAWLRLDPTPSVSEEETRVNAILDWFGSLFDWMNVQWEKYVIKLDSKTQQEQVYEPVWRFWEDAPFGRWLHKFFRNLSIKKIVTVLILIFIALYWIRRAIKFISHLLRKYWMYKNSGTAPIEAKIDFYRRFEKALKKRGFTRQANQTPLEFAQELENMPSFANWAISPTEIAMSYYAVRYGGQTVSALWVKEVMAQLKAANA